MTEIMWLEGYAYRKKIPVNSAPGGLVNYQMLYTVSSGVGTDLAGNVFLNNHALSWPYDIRITQEDGVTPTDFWRESYDSSLQKIWIKVPTIPGSGTTDYYIYYSKAGDSDASNGYNTFPFFDDFENYSLGDLVGQGGWTLFGGIPGEWQIQSSNVHGGSKAIGITTSFDGDSVYKSLSLPYDFELTLWFRMDNSTRNHLVHLMEGDNSRNIGFRSDHLLDGGHFSYYTSGGTRNDTGISTSTAAWYKQRTIVKSNKLIDWYLYDASENLLFSALNKSMYSDFVTGIDKILLLVGNPPSTEYFDDISVRKYVSPEPTWAAPGSEDVPYRIMWLEGYAYRKKIPVNSAPGGLVNYQMLYTVSSGVGTDLAGNVFLNNHALSWPYDIRITQEDGVTPTDFWRESFDANSQKIWIEVPAIPESGIKDYYLYYGKVGDSDASNGVNTFEFFDDALADHTPRGAVPYYYDYRDTNYGNSMLVWDSAEKVYKKTGLSSWGYLGLSNVYKPTYDWIYIEQRVAVNWEHILLGFNVSGVTQQRYGAGMHSNGTLSLSNNTTVISSTGWASDSNFHILGVAFRKSTGEAKVFLDGVQKLTGTLTGLAPENGIMFGHYGDSTWDFGKFGYLNVRKYTDPEPAWAAPGSEEVPAPYREAALASCQWQPCVVGQACTLTATVNQGSISENYKLVFSGGYVGESAPFTVNEGTGQQQFTFNITFDTAGTKTITASLIKT